MPTATPARPGGEARLAGRPVARIGFGAMQLGGPGGLPVPDREDSIALLRAVAAAGVNHLDTAQFYGSGLVNELIHDALAPYPDDLVVVSKVGAEEGETGLRAAQRPEELRASVEANLASLACEQVPVVNLRRVDAPPGIVATGDQIVDLDSQLAELAALRGEGKIGAIGLSNVSLDQVRQALPVGVACVQNAYSYVDRSSEAVLTLCAEHDIAWVPYFPLGSAFPGFPKVVDQPAVVAIAARLAVTPAQVGLAWLLAHDPHTLLIPGTGRLAHLEANLAVGDVLLDAYALAELDAATTT